MTKPFKQMLGRVMVLVGVTGIVILVVIKSF